MPGNNYMIANTTVEFPWLPYTPMNYLLYIKKKNYIYIYIYIYVMMKPPFKASDSAINVLSAPWFDMCTVWFVASLSCINMTLKS